EPNATGLLVQDRLAMAAASYAVLTERERPPEERVLFTLVSFSDDPATADTAFRDQIQALVLRVLSRRVERSGPEVASYLDLWDEVYATTSDREQAWMSVLGVLLRDPEFVSY